MPISPSAPSFVAIAAIVYRTADRLPRWVTLAADGADVRSDAEFEIGFWQ